MPMWTSIMVGDFKNFANRRLHRARFTNNPGENHFDYLKNDLLQRKVRCSEYAKIVYADIEAKYLKKYKDAIPTLMNLTRSVESILFFFRILFAKIIIILFLRTE